jgi:hypothetical protein
MMSGLGFTCSYTTAQDVEGTSPCGRRATRRDRGEPRCLGHRVVEWLVSVYSGSERDRARSIYGTFFFVIFVIGLVWSVQSGIDVLREGQPGDAVLKTIMFLSLAGAAGGYAISFGLEHPLGGRLWLTFAPVLSVTISLTAGDLLPNTDTPSTVSLKDTLTALVYFVVALAILGGWLVFLLVYAAKYRWATALSFVCEALTVVMVLGGVALALVSGGTENSMLIMSAVVIGLAVAVRGVTRLKKLAKILRV